MSQPQFIPLKIFFLVLILLNCTTSKVQTMEASISINVIPKPATIQKDKGNFILNPETKIYFDPDNDEIKSIADYLAEKINLTAGFQLTPELLRHQGELSNSIVMKIQDTHDDLGEEGYELLVKNFFISLTAKGPAGLFYGVQTLRQLLPPEIEGCQKIEPQIHWNIPCVHIVDQPRFTWRGMQLDCCRHFMTKDFVKRYIDMLAYYKMNRFHWHLTEDQGWRIEIKKYPRLTEIGAWRKYEDGTVYGGFYSQEDVREVVAYAKSRYVMIIPEIEMPGHCLAALACYPELSCTGGPFNVSTQWGVHQDVYCAGNEKVFKFLADILTEVIALFPAPYVHIGGDEVPKHRWKQCPSCQARIQAERLNNEEELQSYFIRRMEQFLLTHQRRLIGWDEILEGGLAPGATVQSWRGIDGAIAAAKSGHDAIMSPSNFTYFNSDIVNLDLRQVYSFEPIPQELSQIEASHIIGGECNMWTEFAPQETIDSKMFPRLLAMSEVLWSPPSTKDYLEFHKRVRHHYKRLDRLGIHYGAESRPISILPSVIVPGNEFKIHLQSGEPDLQIYYTLDGKEPDLKAISYKAPIILRTSALIKARAFRDREPYGEVTEKNFIIHRASGRPVKLSFPYSPRYAGNGPDALTDGITGSPNFRDGFWQGFEQDNLEAVIDLGKLIPIRKIRTTFLQNVGSWIFLPEFVEYAISADGANFQIMGRINSEITTDFVEVIIKEFKLKFNRTPARYVKVVAKNIGVCPPAHPGAGGKAWIFVDEIVVE